MSLVATLPKIALKFSAKIFPVPGRFTQMFSLVNTSPFLMGCIVQTVAKAKSMVTCSSSAGFFVPPRIKAISAALTINSAQAFSSILQTISGPVRCM